jgi:hypothetical protein
MSTLLEEIGSSSEWVAQALYSSGYLVDFSPSSLNEIDRFIDEHTVAGEPRPDGLLSVDLPYRAFALGAYTGEVVRLVLGGEWLTFEDDESKDGFDCELRYGGGTIWPMQRVAKRIRNGAEDGIAFYALALGLDVVPTRRF